MSNTKNMEESGLIFRKGDKTDKRIVRIFLTEKGVAARKISKETILNFNDKLLKKIMDKDLDTFVKVLGIIKEQVQNEIENFMPSEKAGFNKANSEK